MKKLNMSVEQVLLLLIIGLAGGVISGAIGVGGGVFIVPFLVMILGITQHQAQGAFIGTAVLPVQILSAYSYYKAGNLDWRISLILVGVFGIGSYLGAQLTNLYLSDAILKKIFGLFLLFTAVKLLFFK